MAASFVGSVALSNARRRQRVRDVWKGPCAKQFSKCTSRYDCRPRLTTLTTTEISGPPVDAIHRVGYGSTISIYVDKERVREQRPQVANPAKAGVLLYEASLALKTEYRSDHQQAQAGIATYFMPRGLQIAVRSGVDVEGIVPSVRAAVRDFDRDLPLHQVAMMEDVVAESLAGPRVMANLLGVFALIALVLATVGIYGVISYSVAGRTREIGVRVALGAERSEIIRLILEEGARPLLAGIALGLAGAWASTRFVASMLFGVAPTDLLTFSLLPASLLAIGMVASWIPALRATRISPTEALREE